MICPACGSENIDGSDRCENCLAPFRDLDVPRADAAEGLARSVMEDKLAKLEFEPTVAITPDTSASEAARQMKDARIGCALVIDNGRLVGIFTEHDVLKRVNDHVLTAISDRDLINEAGYAATVAEAMPIRDVPFNDIPVEEMRAEETDWQPVDTPAAVERDDYGLDAPVKELMSPNPESLDDSDSVAAALNKMSIGNYRHLPVRRSDTTYSVASIKSVLKYIAKEDW